ncbi:MAG TPA: CoA transferase [Thermoprotei archaeon]|nr:CoA transferase [Thermoprotei archaeon]
MYKVVKLQKPLKGVKVADFSRILAGPFATMVLADLGAEIIKIEPPSGDDSRYWAPIIDGESVYFMSTNRGKKSIVINLKTEEGRKIAYDIIKDSDILIENFREGIAKKLGIDYDTVTRIKPDIIYCSIRGFRSGTRYTEKGGADLIIQAMSGLMDTIGEEGGEPVKVSFALFDIIAGLIAVSSILSALYYRNVTGKGMKIETPLYDSAIYSMVYIPMIYLMTGVKPVKMGSAHPSIVPYQAFKCRDGRYIATGAFNDEMWVRFLRTLELDELAKDPRFKTNVDRVRNRRELIKILSERFMEKNSVEWLKRLEENRVPAGLVYGVDEVFKDPYIEEARILSYIKHSKLGLIKQILYPSIINGERLDIDKAPPDLGGDARIILKELGYDDDYIKKLFDDGVVCCK